ncbi:hypothetical protein [Streptomyces sp. NRRL S-350]|uniref:hypothetical protein n=1 Tax=Streptomyces sp. NRRL S-350 TaxID=1463902 RepID=UPI0004BE925D|nr:hypothetical protein [Streptomyces sp. NRRL S-350]
MPIQSDLAALLANLPERMPELPVDPRRRLPIPAVSQHGDFHDFTAINAEQGVRLAQQRRCSICGGDLGYWVAFLGGEQSFQRRGYADPPMHPACAEASLTLCPHIRLQRARRASDSHVMAGATTGEGWVEAKPQRWVLGITRSYDVRMTAARGGGRVPVFRPAPFRSHRVFGYGQNGLITEL